jgi:hypothetical protein
MPDEARALAAERRPKRSVDKEQIGFVGQFFGPWSEVTVFYGSIPTVHP